MGGAFGWRGTRERERDPRERDGRKREREWVSGICVVALIVAALYERARAGSDVGCRGCWVERRDRRREAEMQRDETGQGSPAWGTRTERETACECVQVSIVFARGLDGSRMRDVLI